eukprot:CAMPEP_0204908268 /NCGR_PEP_ID=MMETSP1397-20131031/7248_1 /ASSEMBLY_ACC=CAM_ASM_000891 /TAXON_ID=49980 /ORGANISM="Climacostomum Climacostomum virens, Strain Stock W-24" /LENGTH=45 /DNA_ID= /DNA_START= /DNA_END= /DNA_ORIENTATION=
MPRAKYKSTPTNKKIKNLVPELIPVAGGGTGSTEAFAGLMQADLV